MITEKIQSKINESFRTHPTKGEIQTLYKLGDFNKEVQRTQNLQSKKYKLNRLIKQIRKYAKYLPIFLTTLKLIFDLYHEFGDNHDVSHF